MPAMLMLFDLRRPSLLWERGKKVASTSERERESSRKIRVHIRDYIILY